MSTHTDYTPKTILIYTYADVVGDGFVKLPFLRDLRARFPDAHITWCAGVLPTVYDGVLKSLATGYLDEVLSAAGLGTGLGELFRFRRPLGGRHFDLVIDTQRALIRTLCVRRLRHGLFISGTGNFRFSDRHPAPGWERPLHLVDYLSGLLDVVAAKPDTMPNAPLQVPEEFRAAAHARLPDGPVYVGISPGAGEKARIWPLPGFIKVAKEQVAQGRVPVFLLGPDERDLLDKIKTAVPEARFPEWEEKGGPKGPIFVVALGERLAAAVANDSGTGHMLAAGGAPLLSLFSKHDPRKYSPRSPRQVTLDSQDYGGDDPSLIPVDAVIRALDGLLGKP
ncbi:MAG: ADP-heptose:LPS heptosyltransferase [Alphaproteobacteria bacterium]|jgi:ADP-heptose:LPS heptosyltransferase